MLRAILLAMLLSLASAWQAMAAPLEAYGRLPNIEDAALSPDGSMVALVMTDGENRRVTITRVGENTPFVVINAGDRKLRSIIWAGNDNLLITTSTTTAPEGLVTPARGEWFMTRGYNVRTRSQYELIQRIDRQAMNVLVGGPYVRFIEGRARVFIIGYDFSDISGHSRVSLFSVDLNNHRATVTDPGERETRDWQIDEQGRSVGTMLVARQTGEWRISVRTPGGVWRPLTAGVPAYNDTPSLVSLGRDGRSILVAGREGGTHTLREVDLATGAWSAPIGDGEPEAPLIDPETNRFTALRYREGDRVRWQFFSERDQRGYDAVQAALPGQIVTPWSYSQDRRRVVVHADSPTEGPAFALVDFNSRRVIWLGQLYFGVGQADISPVRYITYRAGDGLEIGAVLTLPRGRGERGLPLVVLPHGGPEAHDAPVFDWWAQALASRGYAVLQPNFRGSSGHGAAFVRAGHGEWGRKMQTDLSDGVAHLAREGLIDPARVCIVGASYGGYAAMAGVTLQHGIYRCAAAFGGVSDPAALVRYSRNRRGLDAQRYWFEFMGVTGQRDPDFALISPLARAREASAPLLLIHGRDDTVVPFSQSDQMYAALRRANLPVELVALSGEDHWLSRGETRLRMLTEIVRFLEQHNPPGPAPEPASAAAPATR